MTTILALARATTPAPDGKPLDIDIAQPGVLLVFVVGFLIYAIVRRKIPSL